MDCSLPGSSIYGIFQSRVLGVGCHCLLRHIMLVSYNMKKVKVLVTQLCSALCNPMECSPPSSSAHGILQARILEWAVMPSSRGSFQPRDQTQVFRTADGFLTVWNQPWIFIERTDAEALATWWKEPTHCKRPWFWERLKAKGEEGSRGWDG